MRTGPERSTVLAVAKNMSLGGGEHHLVAGAYDAAVTGIGGGLRVLRRDGSNLVRPRFSGALLAPWPNRVANGAYVLGADEADRRCRVRVGSGRAAVGAGEGLVLLFPGGDHRAAWTVRAP